MLTRAIIPAAGFGTRMLPAAKAVPKELLPILDRPAIQLVVEEAVAAGIGDILLVVSSRKSAIEDHFAENPALERRLAEGGRAAMLSSIANILAKSKISNVKQHEQLGLGHAVLQAETHIGNEAFLCMLGDAVFSVSNDETPLPAEQLRDAHRRLFEENGPCSVVGLERVPPEKVSRYGIAGGLEVAPNVLRLDRIVEKPSLAQAPSNLAVAARYVLSPTIFSLLKRTPRGGGGGGGGGGEIQLTDAIQALIHIEPVFGVVLASTRHDIGNPLDWLLTNLSFARRDPAIWVHVQQFLDQ